MHKFTWRWLSHSLSQNKKHVEDVDAGSDTSMPELIEGDNTSEEEADEDDSLHPDEKVVDTNNPKIYIRKITVSSTNKQKEEALQSV